MLRNTIAHSFTVDAVAVASEEPESTSVSEAFETVLKGPLEACSTPCASVLRRYGFNGLVEALHQAYAEHRPLKIGPDDIWLLVAQGFATCINAEPHRYRSYFVTHEGKQKIVVRRDEFVLGASTNDWPGVFTEFSEAIRKHIGDETHKLILSDFSTTGAIERAASEVVLMEVVKEYFDYSVMSMCGIPNVTLLGTATDWQNLAQKVRKLKRFEGLDWWLDIAIPVVDQFAAAARGELVLSFWQHLYKGREGSGRITGDGEILKLIPYCRHEKNPLVTGQSQRGIETKELPPVFSSVPFTFQVGSNKRDYQFLAGHVGCQYDPADGSLSPLIGWAVRPKS